MSGGAGTAIDLPMVRRVVIDNVALDQVLDEAQKAGDAIYAMYG
jgi:hypothetical protein